MRPPDADAVGSDVAIKHFVTASVIELGAMTLAELGQAVEAGSRMTVSVALRRFPEQLSQDKSLRKRLAEAKNGLQTRGRLPCNV